MVKSHDSIKLMTCPAVDSHRGHEEENRDHMQIAHATDNRVAVFRSTHASCRYNLSVVKD